VSAAAADADMLPAGARFPIESCGTEQDGSEVPAPVCVRLRAASWTITDEFTPGLGGERLLDVYIGEETGPGFTDSEWYTTLVGAAVHVDHP
jgi:hypothetical protein